MGESQEPREIDEALLRGWPLPQPGRQSDKDARGHVLLIGGAPEMPGAVLLARGAGVAQAAVWSVYLHALAALRAGAPAWPAWHACQGTAA